MVCGPTFNKNCSILLVKIVKSPFDYNYKKKEGMSVNTLTCNSNTAGLSFIKHLHFNPLQPRVLHIKHSTHHGFKSVSLCIVCIKCTQTLNEEVIYIHSTACQSTQFISRIITHTLMNIGTVVLPQSGS